MASNLVVANWKMNLPSEGIETFMGRMNERSYAAGLAVAPPFPFIGAVASAAGNVRVGAQNCHEGVSGAFTGEVSAEMAATAGASMIIVGHSERRKIYGEDDALVAKKVAAVLRAGLDLILCIGESEAEREAGATGAVVERQLRSAFEGVDGAEATIIVAYEPVWAIGTGKSATPDLVAETHAQIGGILDATVGIRPILYGGSVTPDNAASLAAVDGVDGFLVGGASLFSDRFGAIASVF